jgi:hypothetical protein
MRHQAVTSTNELLRAQLEEKERMRGIERDVHNNEMGNFNKQIGIMQSEDQEMKHDNKKKQELYRNIL